MKKIITSILVSLGLVGASVGTYRVIDGQPASIIEYPSVVALVLASDVSVDVNGKVLKWLQGQRIGCGGSFIANNVILTAAHCVDSSHSYPFDLLGNLAIAYGKDVIPYGVANSASLIRVAKVIVHPKYDEATKASDIALLVLESEVQANIAPLPTIPKLIGETVTVVGWGNTVRQELDGSSKGINYPDQLQKAKLKTIDNLTCQKELSRAMSAIVYVDDLMICAKGAEANPNADSCQGDSGGPLFSAGNVQVGVISSGLGCGTGLAGIYSDVYSHVPWICSELPSMASCLIRSLPHNTLATQNQKEFSLMDDIISPLLVALILGIIIPTIIVLIRGLPIPSFIKEPLVNAIEASAKAYELQNQNAINSRLYQEAIKLVRAWQDKQKNNPSLKGVEAKEAAIDELMNFAHDFSSTNLKRDVADTMIRAAYQEVVLHNDKAP